MRKLVGVVVALLLAVVGAGLLASYVNSARDEIRDEESFVSVYVVTNEVAAGSTIDAVLAQSTLQDVPARLVAVGAVSAAEDVPAGLVTDAVLHPGEQVLTDRFVAPYELATADVPAGMQEMTIRLDPERAVGGVINPGSSVAVVVSLDNDQAGGGGEGVVTGEAPATTVATSGQMTQVVLQHVLVTNIQFTSPDDAAAAALIDASTPENIPFTPTAPVLVTVALSTEEVGQIVFAAEFGTIWLTLEGDDVDPATGDIVAGLDVFSLGRGGE